MIISRTAFVAAAVVGSLGLSAARAAITTEKDSADFTYKYEGDAPIVETSGTAWNFGNTGCVGGVSGIKTFSSDGSTLTVETTTAYSSAWFTSGLWAATTDTGWTWEMSFRVDSADAGANNALFVQIGPRTTDHKSEIFGIKTGSIDGLNSVSLLVDTTTTFHTLRFAQDAGSGEFSVWFDGVHQRDFSLPGATGYDAGTLAWGDGSGGTGGKYAIDYIRFTEGGFAPAAVPEPASLGLLGGVVLMGLARRRRG